jgi:hypothetical protein
MAKTCVDMAKTCVDMAKTYVDMAITCVDMAKISNSKFLPVVGLELLNLELLGRRLIH